MSISSISSILYILWFSVSAPNRPCSPWKQCFRQSFRPGIGTVQVPTRLKMRGGLRTAVGHQPGFNQVSREIPRYPKSPKKFNCCPKNQNPKLSKAKASRTLWDSLGTLAASLSPDGRSISNTCPAQVMCWSKPWSTSINPSHFAVETSGVETPETRVNWVFFAPWPSQGSEKRRKATWAWSPPSFFLSWPGFCYGESTEKLEMLPLPIVKSEGMDKRYGFLMIFKNIKRLELLFDHWFSSRSWNVWGENSNDSKVYQIYCWGDYPLISTTYQLNQKTLRSKPPMNMTMSP